METQTWNQFHGHHTTIASSHLVHSFQIFSFPFWIITDRECESKEIWDLRNVILAMTASFTNQWQCGNLIFFISVQIFIRFFFELLCSASNDTQIGQLENLEKLVFVSSSWRSEWPATIMWVIDSDIWFHSTSLWI